MAAFTVHFRHTVEGAGVGRSREGAMKRREFLSGTIGAAAAWQARTIRAETAGRYSAERYAKGIVIDALGGPGGFHPDLPDDAPLTDGDIADVRRSGLTAVNVTVNLVGNGPDRFEKTVTTIALVER